VVAFGDPRYPASVTAAESPGDPALRSLLTRNRAALSPLPATRGEVEQLAALYGDAAATFVGEQATEERVKQLAPQARILHFATHGLLDERFPLDSALALSIPEAPGGEQENGLLQAWEIFERLRLHADLVTLSACDTALGKEAGGEGLVGLTRAFQYAGARSILASLWSVGDASTGELMERFYRYLRAGQSKDEALRRAQLDLLREPATAHPFHWAAFEVIGDWR
jgi:CHAT domain-containing protein